MLGVFCCYECWYNCVDKTNGNKLNMLQKEVGQHLGKRLLKEHRLQDSGQDHLGPANVAYIMEIKYFYEIIILVMFRK